MRAPRGVELVDVVRSGVVESVHRGSMVLLDPDGGTRLALGVPEEPCFTRSANKPIQAVGMVRAGLDLAGADLALVAASHSGEPIHVDRVRALLAARGLDEQFLACPAALPLHEPTRDALLADGGTPARVIMSCSGKHTGMLLTCLANGWPVTGYTDPGHPLQRALRVATEELTGELVAAVGVDGCGAPVFGYSLIGLARAFARLVTAGPGTPPRRVADAMRAHPELVGGTGRETTVLMRAVPGLLLKDGAEGVHAGALPDGSAFALKVDDGASRAGPPLVAAALRLLGVPAGAVAEFAEAPVLGGGRPVGSVRIGAVLRSLP
ncbi:MAG: asparaginase [Actinobacteria bacterium]|nr:asparaginase [Actinomycetota bacterium]MBI3688841.1 asparaginase [Actinomycetota bacterium]